MNVIALVNGREHCVISQVVFHAKQYLVLMALVYLIQMASIHVHVKLKAMKERIVN
jgi:hypothetical protein